MTTPPTAAAIAARQRQTQDKLTRVGKAISDLQRERGQLNVRAVAARAGVSTSFLYANAEARALIRAGIAASQRKHDRSVQSAHAHAEATWRERALNTEAELTRTQKEVLAQRQRVGELMGQLRDFEHMVPGEAVQQFTTENATLKRRVQQLTMEHRTLQERLEGSRSNLRFAEKRIADLEAQLLEQRPTMPTARQQT
ncbi:DUF6262 family protein [Streptomyces sp. H27-G5]|uniref:DUF6262 family protein n=1 Tax=Streptomyces sp. H27-G5 TaxID=2996698 RepID=UPI002271F04D|nr:DUF6262 family protein [Streptomyces sp. H27-G5]MCY0923991.1 DUF6262 family protein [Streptomyces sp. H27-G5]